MARPEGGSPFLMVLLWICNAVVGWIATYRSPQKRCQMDMPIPNTISFLSSLPLTAQRPGEIAIRLPPCSMCHQRCGSVSPGWIRQDESHESSNKLIAVWWCLMDNKKNPPASVGQARFLMILWSCRIIFHRTGQHRHPPTFFPGFLLQGPRIGRNPEVPSGGRRKCMRKLYWTVCGS